MSDGWRDVIRCSRYCSCVHIWRLYDGPLAQAMLPQRRCVNCHCGQVQTGDNAHEQAVSAPKERTWEQIQAEDLTLCAKETRGGSMTTAQEFRDAAARMESRATHLFGDIEGIRLLLAAAEQADELERGIDREMALAARIERAEAHVATLTARVAELEAKAAK